MVMSKTVNLALLPGWPNCSEVSGDLPPGTYSRAKDWIATIAPPVIIVFGLFGNILTVVVLSRSVRKCSNTTLYLIALAVSDTVFLLNGPLRQWMRLVWNYDVRSLHEGVCKVSVFFTYGSLQFSSMILVALTLERVVSVLWPHRVRTCCTSSAAKAIIFVLFVCVSGLNSHWFYGVGTSTLRYYTVKTCMPLYENYSYFFHHVWHWINFAVAFAVPFLVLAVGNGIIISKLKKFQMKRKRMSVTKAKDTESEREQKTLTVVLILLSTVFFLSQTPMAIYYIYAPYGIEKANELACDNYPEYKRQAEIIWLCYTVVNILGYLNAMLNFVLYVISGSRFRTEIIALFRCQRSRSAGVFENSYATSVNRDSRRMNNTEGSCTENTVN